MKGHRPVPARLDFVLPADLEASEPPEARGLARDEVRLMVSRCSSGEIVHARFRDVNEFLRPGDLLLINTSGTLPAAIEATRSDGMRLELHLSTHLPDGRWTIELRLPDGGKTAPFGGARAGEMLRLDGGGSVTLVRPHAPPAGASVRLWDAELQLTLPEHDYLDRYGSPIRYSYVRARWPIEYYQNVFSNEPGSAEMPSAGRGFTTELITRLVASGVQVAPLVLHTGVSSQEDHEPPFEEYFRVPATTARLVNETRTAKGRVIAIGTTVVRALETVADDAGTVREGEGWTPLVVTAERGVRAVDGLLTGLHEPRASHLAMLEAVAGRDCIASAYDEALRRRYLWHEFGDLHLLLP
jgi:S-adenosylmethionine:tRNA ribosyltransferase-isomerase